MAFGDWSCLDKTVLVSFCINCALLVLTVMMIPWLEGLMSYPALLQVIKCVVLGLNLFGFRMT